MKTSQTSPFQRLLKSWFAIPPIYLWVGWTIYLAFCGTLLYHRISFSHTVTDLLPETHSLLGKRIQLMQELPLSKRVLLFFESDTPQPLEHFFTAIQTFYQLIEQKPEFLVPEIDLNFDMFHRSRRHVIQFLPLYWDSDKLGNWETILLDANFVTTTLQQTRHRLGSLEGVLEKEILLLDPLQLHKRIFELWGIPLETQPGTHPSSSSSTSLMIDPQGRYVIIPARTSIPFSDFVKAKELLLYVKQIENKIPFSIRVSLYSGHAYTVANTECIQSDSWRVLVISLIVLLILGWKYFRYPGGWMVLLVPIHGLISAMTLCGLLFPKVSFITIGFGSILLGIGVDMGIHTSLHLHYRQENIVDTLSKLFLPLLFCVLTTMVAFSMLFFCSIPVYTQLAVFILFGLFQSWLFAFLFLGHGVQPSNFPFSQERWMFYRASHPLLSGGIALILILPQPFFLSKVPVVQDLNALNYRTPLLIHQEQILHQHSSSLQQGRFLVVHGENLPQLKSHSYILTQWIRKQGAALFFPTLSDLLPPQEVLQKRLDAWKHFYHHHHRDIFRIWGQANWSEKAIQRILDTWNPDQLSLDISSIQGTFFEPIIQLASFSLEGRPATVLYLPSELSFSEEELRQLFPGIHLSLLVPKEIGKQIYQTTMREFILFTLLGVLCCIVLLFILFRRMILLISAFVPVIAGLLSMSLIMGIFRFDLNLFNTIGALLVCGLAVDYGIFMVHSYFHTLNPVTILSVALSAVSTMVSFGLLVLAQHPAMFSLGVTILPGILGALIGAVIIVPTILAPIQSKGYSVLSN